MFLLRTEAGLVLRWSGYGLLVCSCPLSSSDGRGGKRSSTNVLIALPTKRVPRMYRRGKEADQVVLPSNSSAI